jgi:hypothetical protein
VVEGVECVTEMVRGGCLSLPLYALVHLGLDDVPVLVLLDGHDLLDVVGSAMLLRGVCCVATAGRRRCADPGQRCCARGQRE